MPSFPLAANSGQYLATGTMKDADGKTIPMDFLDDVAQPLLKEFAIGFVSSAATMGAGHVAGRLIGTYVLAAQGGKAVDRAALQILQAQTNAVGASFRAVAREGGGDIAKSLVRRGLENTAVLLKETAKGTAIGAMHAGIGSGLEQIDHNLAAVYHVLAAARSNAKATALQRGVQRRLHMEQARITAEGDTLVIPCKGDRKALLNDLADRMRKTGYPKAVVEGEALHVTLPDGKTVFKIALEAPEGMALVTLHKPPTVPLITRSLEETAPT